MKNKPVAKPLTCAFGEPWMGEHPKCAAWAAEMSQQFREAVARGEYDEQGFRRKERHRDGQIR